MMAPYDPFDPPPPAAGDPQTIPPPPPRGFRLGDYIIGRGTVTLRKTGNTVAFDRRLLAEVAGWLLFQAMVLVHRLGRPRSRHSIWFTPDVPHPRYMVRAAALWAGIGIAASAEAATASFYFEDATCGRVLAAPPGSSFNFTCHDISKSRVAAVFADTFGYPLSVDPRTHQGPAVEKAERNGAHDGRIVDCPREPLAGKTYQRLIDTADADGAVIDLRTPCVGGRPVVVWVKHRPAAARFLAPNTSVVRSRPDEIFSAAELDRIAAFTRAMGADWCSLDILRDRDGRIYVVDLNKTDAGPIVALSLGEKLAGVTMLSAALEELLARAAPD